MTESELVTDETVTDSNSVPSVITRIHTLFINQGTTETAKTDKNDRVFEHVNKKTGLTVKMGEGEIKRYIRIYTKRFRDAQNEFIELKESGETDEMIQKKQEVVESNRTQLQYWEHALVQVTEETPKETAVTLLKAA